jgi:hypothetical protein
MVSAKSRSYSLSLPFVGLRQSGSLPIETKTLDEMKKEIRDTFFFTVPFGFLMKNAEHVSSRLEQGVQKSGAYFGM